MHGGAFQSWPLDCMPLILWLFSLLSYHFATEELRIQPAKDHLSIISFAWGLKETHTKIHSRPRLTSFWQSLDRSRTIIDPEPLSVFMSPSQGLEKITCPLDRQKITILLAKKNKPRPIQWAKKNGNTVRYEGILRKIFFLIAGLTCWSVSYSVEQQQPPLHFDNPLVDHYYY